MKFLGLAAALVFCGFAFGESTPSSAPDTSFQRFGGVPALAFSEATSWQYGALVMAFFKPIGPEDPGSQVDFAVLRTLRNQTRVVISPDLAFQKGHVRWESDWQYKNWPGKYWAGGNTPTDSALNYDMSLWNMNGTIKWSWNHQVHLGFHYDLESNHAHFLTPDSADWANDSSAYPQFAPSNLGGARIGFGYEAEWDSRDHDNWPRHGLYVELRQALYRKEWGSAWNYLDTKLDARYFVPAPLGSALGFAAYWNAIQGTAPFDKMSLPDGVYHLRGLEEGRLSDKQQLVWQTECRVPLFWRFSGAAFAEAGQVGPDVGSLLDNEYHYAFGLGGRFALNPSRKLNVRADLSWVDGGIGLTVYYKEAF